MSSNGEDLRGVLLRMGETVAALREQQRGVLVYDMVLPTWPDGVYEWTPMRNVFRGGSRCYSLPSGNMVHVKPGCRC